MKNLNIMTEHVKKMEDIKIGSTIAVKSESGFWIAKVLKIDKKKEILSIQVSIILQF